MRSLARHETPDDDAAPTARLAAVARESERRLSGSPALAPYLAHAKNVALFAEAVAEAKLAVKRAFVVAGLDYQLARHATWIAETVERFASEYPQVVDMGPSFVLLVREAERRFARENRGHELPRLIDAISVGTPRREVRERFLPPAGIGGPARVLQELKAGRIEAARRTFAACAGDERDALRRLAHALVRVVDDPTVAIRKRTLPASIEEALHDFIDDVPGYTEEP